MPGEPIGNISVVIDGDFSPLDTALNDSVISAELGGGKIAQSFNAAANGTNEWTQALSRSTTATESEVDALGAAADKVRGYSTAVENVLGPERDQLDVLAQLPKSYTEMTAAQQRAVEKMNEQANASRQASDSTRQAGDATDYARDALGRFAGAAESATNAGRQATAGTIDWSTALKLLGVDLSARAIKDFITDAIETYAAVEKASIAINALTHSAAGADAIISNLRDLAMQDALSFPAVLQAEQRFLAFGVAADQIPGALRAIADSAAATGNNFTQVANVFERIVESGQVQGRTLTQLGINLKDLAAALNTTEAEARKTFAALDVADRITTLEIALHRFQGTAEEVADSVSGHWQKLGNEFEATMTRLGEAAGPVAGVAMKAMEAVLTNINILITVQMEEWRKFISILELFSGLDLTGKLDLLHKNLDKVGKGATTAGDQFKEAWKSSAGVLDSAVADIIDKQEGLNMKAIQTYDTWQKLKQAFEDGSLLGGKYAVTVDMVTRAHNEYKKALDESNNAQKGHILSLGELNEKTQLGASEVNKAMRVLEQANALDDSTANKKILVAEAIKQLTQASKKYSDQVTDANVLAIQDAAASQQVVDKAVALREALSDVADETGSYSLATDKALTSLTNFLSSNSLLLSDLDRIKSGLIPLGPIYKQLGFDSTEALQKTADRTRAAADIMGAFNDTVTREGVLAWQAWSHAAQQAANATSIVQIAAHEMGITTITDLTVQRDRYLKLINDMRASGEGGWEAIRQAMLKVRDLQDAINAAMSPLTQAYKELGIESANQLRVDLARKQAAAEMLSGTEDYHHAIEAVQKAQERLNEALGITDNHMSNIGKHADGLGPKLTACFDAGTSAVEKLLSALGKTVDKLNAIEQSLLKAAQRWDDFQKNLNIAGGIGDKSGGSTLGTVSNPFVGLSSPDEMQKAMNDFMGQFAGSSPFSPGVRATYTAMEALLNFAIQDWYKKHPFFDSAGNAPATNGGGSTSSVPADPGTRIAITELQPFLKAVADIRDPSTWSVFQDLTTSVTGLNTTVSNASITISGSFASLSPVIQQATTQIAASVQQQAASFSRLSDALAPITAPQQTISGPLASFQRLPDPRVLGGNSSTLNTVNNMTITTTPDEQSLLDQLVIMLQRRGIRM